MEKVDYDEEWISGKELPLRIVPDSEHVEKIKLYRVKLGNGTFLSSPEWSIFVDNICRYEHKEAIKKAKMFKGKAVHMNEFEIRQTVVNSFYKIE